MDRIGAAGYDARVSISQMARAAGGEALRVSRGEAVSPSSVVNFGTALKAALNHVSATQNGATALSQQFQLGNREVSLEETVIAGQKSQIAFQAALQVRNRVVQAYQEIMQMNV